MMQKLRTSMLVGVLTAVATLLSGASYGAEKDVKFSLDFIPDGFHAPFYAALDKGFFSDAGLNVRISRGYGSADTVRKVAAGEFDIGLAHMVPLIAAVAKQNIEVRGVMQYMERDMLAIWVRDEGTINSIKDLEGKTGASPAGNAQLVFFPALAKAAGFDASKVKWLTADATLLGPMLIQKIVDFIPLYMLHGPRLIPQAAERGIKLKAFPYAEYGLDTYAEALILRNETIMKDPDMVSAFVGATLKGIRWAADNPEEAAKIVVKHNPEMFLSAASGAWELTKTNMFTEKALRDGIGRFESGKLTTTIDTVVGGLDLPRTPTNEEIATNQFMPK